MITRDKIHEVIQMSVGWIQYSELMSTHECCSTTLSNILDLYKPTHDSLDSYLLLTYDRLWMVLNNLVIPEE